MSPPFGLDLVRMTRRRTECAPKDTWAYPRIRFPVSVLSPRPVRDGRQRGLLGGDVSGLRDVEERAGLVVTQPGSRGPFRARAISHDRANNSAGASVRLGITSPWPMPEAPMAISIVTS